MRRLLLLACAVFFLYAAFFSVLTPLLPGYRAAHGLGEGAAGVLAGSYGAGTLVMALPAGWIAARFGSRQTTIMGLAGFGILSPVFGFADSIVLLDIARFLQGSAGALMWCGAMSWVISAFPHSRRGQVIGTLIATAVMGEMLGAPLGAAGYVVGTEAVFGSVAVVVLVLIVGAFAIPDVAEVGGQPLRQAAGRLRNSRVSVAVIMLAAPSIAFGLLMVAAPLRMDDLGGSPLVIAAAFACGSVVEAVLGPVIGRVSDRSGHVAPYLTGLVILIVAVIGLGVSSVLSLLFGAVLLAAFGAGLSFTPANTLLSQGATAAGINQGYAAGAAIAALGGGQMVGAVAGGLIASYFGFLLPTLFIAAILITVGFFARGEAEPLTESQIGNEPE